MPFAFQLLIEFFLPGMVLFCSVALLIELFYRSQTVATLSCLANGSEMTLAVAVFTIGLACYFLGTVVNAVSNRLIRVWMAGYRRTIIRRKLSLETDQGIESLQEPERSIVARFLPRVRSRSADDTLNEVYASARSFCLLSSDRSAKAIDYHWAMVRLARATLLPLIVLGVMFAIRSVIHDAHAVNVLGFLASVILFGLTFMTYRYREKFLIYTVFDMLFLIATQEENKHVSSQE